MECCLPGLVSLRRAAGAATGPLIRPPPQIWSARFELPWEYVEQHATLAPESRPSPAIADPGAANEMQRPHRLAVLAGALEREQAVQSATATTRQQLERAASLATLAPMWADVTRAHATRQYEQIVASVLTGEE